MYSALRPWLFKMDAEKAHDVTLSALAFLPQFCFTQPRQNKVEAMGLEFSHPVGLAAGLDKNGEYVDGLAKIGFSFIEVGTVTPRPQIGNPKPRLFRVPETEALVNRMGFNNQGVDVLVQNIQAANYQGILGINIGKNKDTPLSKAADDYLYCFKKVYEHASYVTINISSPNTPDLRQLQQKVHLADILGQLKMEQTKLSDQFQRYVPLVVKISPDESVETIKEMAGAILNYEIDGVIATNTSSSRVLFKSAPRVARQGGLSGKPLLELSTACLGLLKEEVGNAVTLIGVGGIDSVESAQQKIDAGASLVQVYSGLIYQGPELVSRLANRLVIRTVEEDVSE